MRGVSAMLRYGFRKYKRNSRAWRLSPDQGIALAAIPVIFVMLMVALVPASDLFVWLIEEDSVVEWLQFLLLLTTSLLLTRQGVWLLRQRSWRMGLLYGGVALAAFFVSGEEIAWGQRIFGWGTPEALQAVNYQNETTLHNIGPVHQLFIFLIALVSLYGALAPLLAVIVGSGRPRSLLSYLLVPPLCLVPAFVMPFGYRFGRQLLQLDVRFPDLIYYTTKFSEVSEVCLYFGLAVFAWFHLRLAHRLWIPGSTAPGAAVRSSSGTPLLQRAERWLALLDDNPLPLLAPLLLAALFLGVVKLWLDPPSFEFNWANRWWQIGLNVARGYGYVACKPLYFPFCSSTNQITAMREPRPVLLFAFIARVANESLLVAAAFGILINMATVVAVFYLARELANTRTGLLAALLWTLYLAPIRLFYSQISGDLLATLCLTASMVYFLRALRQGGQRRWLFAGAYMGLAILSRSAALAVALALTGALVVQQYRSRKKSGSATWRRVLQPAVLFALAWAVIITPWLVRNTVVFGRPVIGSTLSGYYLFRQNHMLSSDNYLRFVSGGEFLPVLEQTLAHRPDLRGTENEAQMDAVYRQEALRSIAGEPARYATLSAYRFLMLWFNWRVNEAYGKDNTWGDYVIIVQHGLLLAAGLVGLWSNLRRAWPLALGVATFSSIYMAVMAHVPYVVPVMPFLVTLAAAAAAPVMERLAAASHEGQAKAEALASQHDGITA